MARGRLPEARREIEAAPSKLRGTTNTHEALYLGGALLIASRIAAGQTRYTDAEAAATEALHLFEQRARDPQLSAEVGEALLILAQDRRVEGDSDGARRFASRAVAGPCALCTSPPKAVVSCQGCMGRPQRASTPRRSRSAGNTSLFQSPPCTS